jgi:pimeloyl-ACP methyl ester carboxylesterase
VAQSIAEPSLRRRPHLVSATYWASRRRAFRSTVPKLLAHALDFRTPRDEAALTPAELARIQAPVLYVHGRDEKYLPVDAGRRAVEAMADGRLLEVEGGHVPWLADPATTAALWVQDTAAAA